jgi:co-chaperonin GroES (HSP10)
VQPGAPLKSVDVSKMSPADLAIAHAATETGRVPTSRDLVQQRLNGPGLSLVLPTKAPPCTYEPLGDTIVIKPKDKPTETFGGIQLTKAAADQAYKDLRRFGIVVAVGPGVLLNDGTRAAMPDIQIGDEVVASQILAIKPDGPDGDEVVLAPASAIMTKIRREPVPAAPAAVESHG